MGPCTSLSLAHRPTTRTPVLPEGEACPMKVERALLLVAFILIFFALVAGITGANPVNPANTNTGTLHVEHVGGELSSTSGESTFTGTLQHK